uniref:Craniofacial development protein 2 n=1 Tax=Cacopsylla melanoneura TaxID=428564 RepID=A0A8D8PVV0_9HEMI
MPRNNGLINWQRTRNNYYMDSTFGQRNGLKKNDLTIATWNVLTLRQAGKMQEVANEMKKFKIDLIAMQEVRWQGKGKLDKKEYSLIYSGPEENTGQRGTGFLINQTIKKSIMEYEAINDRICRLRLKGKFRNITIISAYAPTEVSNMNDKETFYEELDTVCNNVPKHDMLLVMGDLNAQIGKYENQSQVAGRFTLHEWNNENGELLTEFAARNRLHIRSTSFQHKDIHLGTWKMWGTNQVNQIDHVLVSTRHYSSITDIRSCRAPNCDSDHFLVRTKIKEKLSIVHQENKAKTIKWNTDVLKKDPISAATYREALRSKWAANNRTNQRCDNIDEKWDEAKNTILEVARENIGEKEHGKNEDWFDEKCKQIIERKNQARNIMMNTNTRSNAETYRNLRRESKKVIRSKKREALKQKVKEIDELSKENEQRKFYAAINKMKNGFQPRMNACRDRNGEILTNNEEILNRWTQHFKELLNEEESELSTQNQHEQQPEQEAEENLPTLQEIQRSIQKMKNNRAPGIDNINAELLKYGGDATDNMMLEIIQMVWKEEKMPENWTTGVLCPIHKKGDKTNCTNFRGIMLLNTAYKIFTSILNDRLKEITDEKIGEYQCGFRRDKGTTDQIFVLRQIMEKCNEHDIDLHILFIDFQQAFDNVKRQKVEEALEDLEVPNKIINLIMMTMKRSKAQVKIDNHLSNPFEINKGVRQGDGLSATLFIILLHFVIKHLDQRGTIFNKTTQICAYADDIGLIARTKARLVEVCKELEEKAKEVGLAVNVSKTQYMYLTADKTRLRPVDLQIDQRIFKGVTTFKYLGNLIDNEAQCTTSIKDRIQAGFKAFYANINLLKNKLLNRSAKMQIYKTLIRPVVTYGSETWTLTVADRERLRRFERKIIRKIYGGVKENNEWRIRYNHELNDILENKDIVRFIKSRRIQWFGHLQRMDDSRMPKRILNAKVYNPRRRGRPKMRWIDNVTEDLRTMRVTGWCSLVKDRRRWRQIVEEAEAHFGL